MAGRSPALDHGGLVVLLPSRSIPPAADGLSRSSSRAARTALAEPRVTGRARTPLGRHRERETCQYRPHRAMAGEEPTKTVTSGVNASGTRAYAVSRA